MATIREESGAAWRQRLVPASFAGVEFHVEQQARNSGRRVVTHEYPKRNVPYAEDMGRHARRYQITGYLVGPNYDQDKLDLISVLENSDGGPLIDPYLGGEELVCICERYSVTEVRERGGYCVFEMAFVELGAPGNTQAATDTKSDVNSKADNAGTSAADMVNNAIASGQGPESAANQPA